MAYLVVPSSLPVSEIAVFTYSQQQNNSFWDLVNKNSLSQFSAENFFICFLKWTYIIIHFFLKHSKLIIGQLNINMKCNNCLQFPLLVDNSNNRNKKTAI